MLLPGFAQLSLTDVVGNRFGFADITVEQRPSGSLPPAKLWAFITVTHTESHQVGVFTPRGLDTP